jgi:hypothetical protein
MEHAQCVGSFTGEQVLGLIPVKDGSCRDEQIVGYHFTKHQQHDARMGSLDLHHHKSISITA